MSALTVTLGADISALKRGMAAATQLVAASARRMSAIGAAGLAGIDRGGAAALESGFSAAGTAMKASIAAAPAGGAAAAGVGMKAVTAADLMPPNDRCWCRRSLITEKIPQSTEH